MHPQRIDPRGYMDEEHFMKEMRSILCHPPDRQPRSYRQVGWEHLALWFEK